MIGFAAIMRRTRTNVVDRRLAYWGAVARSPPAVTLVCVVPTVSCPTCSCSATRASSRSLNEAAIYSADWRAYLASSALGHRWMQGLIGRWNEVLFPGFVATLGGIAGACVGWRRGGRDARNARPLWFAGDHRVLGVARARRGSLQRALSLGAVLTWLRAPARFGIVVALGLSVLRGSRRQPVAAARQARERVRRDRHRGRRAGAGDAAALPRGRAVRVRRIDVLATLPPRPGHRAAVPVARGGPARPREVHAATRRRTGCR